MAADPISTPAAGVEKLGPARMRDAFERIGRRAPGAAGTLFLRRVRSLDVHPGGGMIILVLRAPSRRGPKKVTKTSLDSALLQEARDLGIDLSAALDEALAEIVRRKRAERWLAENQAAIAAYNAHLDKLGAFSEPLRGF
jgi:antitoxin CcdA